MSKSFFNLSADLTSVRKIKCAIYQKKIEALKIKELSLLLKMKAKFKL